MHDALKAISALLPASLGSEEGLQCVAIWQAGIQQACYVILAHACSYQAAQGLHFTLLSVCQTS
jgi:hypothetical protein